MELSHVTRRIAAFKDDLNGSTSMIFGLSVVPIVLMVAAGIDYSNAIQQKAKLQQATDATALAVTRNMTSTSTPETLLAQAKQFLAGVVDDPNAVITSGPTVNSTNTALCMTTASTSRATLMQAAVGIGLAPPSTVVVSGSSCTKINDVIYEVALVLDNSGSMSQATSGTTKIQSLQVAANQMLTTLNPKPATPRASFSIVPFSSAVKVGAGYASASFMDTGGKSSTHWQNFALPSKVAAKDLPTSKFDLIAGLSTTAKPVSWAGCVEERPDPYMTTDTAANVSTPDTLFVPYFYPDIHSTSASRSGRTWGDSTNSYIKLDSDGEAGSCSSGDQYDLADANSTTIRNTVANTVWNTTQTKVCKYIKTGTDSKVGDNSYYGSDFPAGPNLMCDSRPITTMTNDNAVLTSAINALYAKGDTNIVGGIMWGWRTISPNGPFNTQTTAAGAIGNQNAKSYTWKGTNGQSNAKVMIVMTDGMNHWSSLSTDDKPKDPNGSVYNSLGFYNNARLGSTTESNYRSLMDAKTLQACTNAKAAGIQIYTVGFSIPSNPIDADGLSLLKNCASKTTMAYVAQDGSALISTFQQIARDMTGLRLTH